MVNGNRFHVRSEKVACETVYSATQLHMVKPEFFDFGVGSRAG